MLFQSSFGYPLYCPVNPVVGLFDAHPLGTRLGIGTDSSFWVGSFAGITDGVAVLTNAQLFANMGKPIDGIRPLVRIPLKMITFVSLAGERGEREEKEGKGEKGENK